MDYTVNFCCPIYVYSHPILALSFIESKKKKAFCTSEVFHMIVRKPLLSSLGHSVFDLKKNPLEKILLGMS